MYWELMVLGGCLRSLDPSFPNPSQPDKPKAGLLLCPPAQKGQNIVPLGAGTPSGLPLPPATGKERAGEPAGKETPQTRGFGESCKKRAEFCSNTSGARETRLRHAGGFDAFNARDFFLPFRLIELQNSFDASGLVAAAQCPSSFLGCHLVVRAPCLALRHGGDPRWNPLGHLASALGLLIRERREQVLTLWVGRASVQILPTLQTKPWLFSSLSWSPRGVHSCHLLMGETGVSPVAAPQDGWEVTVTTMTTNCHPHHHSPHSAGHLGTFPLGSGSSLRQRGQAGVWAQCGW